MKCFHAKPHTVYLTWSFSLFVSWLVDLLTNYISDEEVSMSYWPLLTSPWPLSNNYFTDQQHLLALTSLLCQLELPGIFWEVERRSLCVRPSPTYHRRILTYHLCDTYLTQRNIHITSVTRKQDMCLRDGNPLFTISSADHGKLWENLRSHKPVLFNSPKIIPLRHSNIQLDCYLNLWGCWLLGIFQIKVQCVTNISRQTSFSTFYIEFIAPIVIWSEKLHLIPL